jgi:hypothetical protein
MLHLGLTQQLHDYRPKVRYLTPMRWPREVSSYNIERVRQKSMASPFPVHDSNRIDTELKECYFTPIFVTIVKVRHSLQLSNRFVNQ